jgi:hypothetical protein
MIRIPRGTPDSIIQELNAAFKLYWIYTGASANRIEILLTQQKIKRYTVNAKKRRIRLDLHARIRLYQPEQPEIAESLLAVKWLGNAGSHSEGLTPEDLFDGLDLLEHVLEELYEQRTRKLHGLRKLINKRKGPRSRR